MTPVTRILHRAGNARDRLSLAAHPAVDVIEADVWVRGGAIVAHHERPLGALPLMLDGPRLRRARRDPVRIEELLAAAGGHAGLMLDLRSWFRDPAPALAGVLLPLADRSRLSVSCESWPVADRLRAWIPDLRVAYSVKSGRRLRRYLAGRAGGTIDETAVTVRHTLLHSAEDVAALRRSAGRVVAWTVDDVDRAIELAGWRVDGIVSNDLQVLNAL